MTAMSRKEIARRQSAARAAVLRRLKAEMPGVYAAWMADAYQRLDRPDTDA